MPTRKITYKVRILKGTLIELESLQLLNSDKNQS